MNNPTCEHGYYVGFCDQCRIVELEAIIENTPQRFAAFDSMKQRIAELEASMTKAVSLLRDAEEYCKSYIQWQIVDFLRAHDEVTL